MQIPLLIQKLVDKGIEKQLVAAIGEFMIGREAIVDSHRTPILKGVPQGSVLSPILFILFVNDLIEELDDMGIILLGFADDMLACLTGEYQLW